MSAPTCHAARVAEAEREVVEKAVQWDAWSCGFKVSQDLRSAVTALGRARAETCPKCDGHGRVLGDIVEGFDPETRTFMIDNVPCPAGCDAGRKVTP